MLSVSRWVVVLVRASLMNRQRYTNVTEKKRKKERTEKMIFHQKQFGMEIMGRCVHKGPHQNNLSVQCWSMRLPHFNVYFCVPVFLCFSAKGGLFLPIFFIHWHLHLITFKSTDPFIYINMSNIVCNSIFDIPFRRWLAKWNRMKAFAFSLSFAVEIS